LEAEISTKKKERKENISGRAKVHRGVAGYFACAGEASKGMPTVVTKKVKYPLLCEGKKEVIR